MTGREHINTPALHHTISQLGRAAAWGILPAAAFVSGMIARGLHRPRNIVDAYLDDASELVELGRKLEAEHRDK